MPSKRYKKALEVVDGDPASAARIAEARWRMASALKALGKLSMCEHELREILKLKSETGPRIQVRTLLHLGSVYRLGVALHKLDDPAIVLGVCDRWILQPEDPWEVVGYVHNVVFT